MKKLKTHISGLDELFQGGIQIDCKTRYKDDDDSSLVIVIKGERGTNKHLFAMQLMHGLARSMRERNIEMKIKNVKEPQQYYSINKPTQGLEDMYLDLLISRWIYAMTKAFKRQYTYQIENESESKDGSRYDCTQDQINFRESALRFWFDVDNRSGIYPIPSFTRSAKNRDYSQEYSQMLADNIISYNPRTNAIHYRRLFQGDSNENLLFYRKYDDIERYRSDYESENCQDIHQYSECDNNIDYSFSTEFVNVKFNKHQNKEEAEAVISRNSRQALSSFQKILREIETEISKKDKAVQQNSNTETKECKCNEASGKFLHDVVVIDGFSHIDSESLKTLPYTHFQNKLRRYARVSILVFDDRKEADCDGDIIIDLRINTDEEQNYTYHELQISKSTFQSRALGWHRFKRRDYGIVVFPSIHLRLTRRYYIANLLNEIGNGVLEDTYSSYLSSKLHSDCIKKAVPATEDRLKDYFNSFYYENYLSSQQEIDKNLLWELYSQRFHPRFNNSDDADNISDKGNAGKFDYITCDILPQLLLGESEHYAGRFQIRPYYGYATHFPVTVFIGNPNSFKRKMVLSKAFHWAKKKEHVLFVLFDKNEEDVRHQMLCPGIHSRINGFKDKEDFDAKTSECRNCNRFIHYLGLRPGCISAEEFLSVLLEQIEIYCDRDARYGIERRSLHIIIDDYQRIDFSFPFIKASSLFTCALINICQEHNVELTILCDKSSERAHEVCTLSDNVLCVRRDPEDLNSFRLYVERLSEPPFPSAIIRYDIKDAQNLFECNGKELRIKDAHDIKHSYIGSMKEYWRKTENVVNKNSKTSD